MSPRSGPARSKDLDNSGYLNEEELQGALAMKRRFRTFSVRRMITGWKIWMMGRARRARMEMVPCVLLLFFQAGFKLQGLQQLELLPASRGLERVNGCQRYLPSQWIAFFSETSLELVSSGGGAVCEEGEKTSPLVWDTFGWWCMSGRLFIASCFKCSNLRILEGAGRLDEIRGFVVHE